MTIFHTITPKFNTTLSSTQEIGYYMFYGLRRTSHIENGNDQYNIFLNQIINETLLTNNIPHLFLQIDMYVIYSANQGK